MLNLLVVACTHSGIPAVSTKLHRTEVTPYQHKEIIENEVMFGIEAICIFYYTSQKKHDYNLIQSTEEKKPYRRTEK